MNAIEIDCLNDEVKIRIDCISRVGDGPWGFNSEHNVDDGVLIFTGVTYYKMEPPGFIPDDFIGALTATLIEPGKYEVIMELDMYVTATLHATGAAIEDPKRPGYRIVD